MPQQPQDPWSAAAQELNTPPPTAAPTTPPPSQDPWSQAASELRQDTPTPKMSSPTAAPAGTDLWSQAASELSPENGQSKPAEKPEESKGFIGKAWDWANTPLINFNKDNTGGFTGGAEDVASGLTSPLSIGLTAATLGGGAVLRGLGIAAEEMPVAIRGIKSLIDAGFTAQGAVQVVKESPRVLDALKEGDYETAKRLAVHVVAGGAMVGLGGRQIHEDLGSISDSLKAGAGLKVKPSEINKQLAAYDGVRSREVNESQDRATVLNKQWNKDFEKLSPVERGAAGKLMAADNREDLIDRHDYLAEAMGQPEKKIRTALTPELKPVQDRGLIYRGEFPEGSYSFQDSQTGGSINISKDSSLADANAKIDAHRAGIDVQKMDDTLQGKQKASAERWEEHQEYRENAAKQLLKDKPQEYKENLLKQYEQAINPTPDIQNLAARSGGVLKDELGKAQQNGVIKEGIENYLTSIWKPEDLNNPATNKLRDQVSTGRFPVTASMAKHRVFKNAFEGELLGRELKTGDPITLTSQYINKLGEVIANRNFKENVLDNVRASDGRPIAALSGAGKLVTDENGDASVMVNPKGMRNIRISDDRINALKSAGELDRMIESGAIVKIPHENKDLYAWNTHDYKSTGSSALEDWNYAAHAPDGTPAFVKSEFKIHPEGHEYLNRLLGQEKSPIQQIKPLNWLLKASSEAKHLMLSFSPFHIVQEGLRAVMTGMSPFHLDRLDINQIPELKTLVEEGLVRNKEHLGLQDFEKGLEEGVGGKSWVVNKVGKIGDALGIAGKPLSIARDIQNKTTEFLFDRYLPALKERAALALNERWKSKLQDQEFFDKLQKQHPEFQGLTPERAAARLAGTEANERFGGLNYRQMGRSIGTQDFLRLTTLAPDWLESELRSIKRVFDPTGGNMLRKDLVRMTAIMFATSRALNYLLSGKPHLEAPFGVAHVGEDGKEKIYSLRTLPTDMLHAATDPVGFMRGRLSPFARTASEVVSGRDYQGRKMTPGATAVDIVRNNLLPIGAQAILKGATGNSPDLTNVDQGVKALGGTAQVYRTEAQKLANELSANKNEQGPVDTHKLAQHRAVAEVEDKIRSGQVSKTVLNDLHEQGLIGKSEVKRIDKVIKETAGMDPEQAKLYSQANRLAAPDFLKIWDAATPAEQALLTKQLIAKRKSYIEKIQKEFPPAVWSTDPTYKRLKEMFPSAPNY